MRRFIPTLLLGLAALTPFALTGCGDLIAKLKGGGADADAAADAATLVATAAPAVEAGVAPTAAPTETGTAPPLTTTTTTATPTAAPTQLPRAADAGVAVDAGAKPADAGAPAADAGKAPPTPVPTLPSFFDAGALKGFDAGGFKPPWQK